MIGIQEGRVRGRSTAAYLVGYVQFLVRAFWWISRLHFRRRFHAVHVNNMPNFLVFSAVIPRLDGAGVLLDIHDSMPELFATKFGPRFARLARPLLEFEERLSAGFATTVTCVNLIQEEVTVDHGVPAEKLAVIMNLPDEKIFGRPLPEPAAHEPFTLAYHGLLSWRLGVDLVIDALAELHAHPENYRYRIVGTGDAELGLRHTVERLGLSSVVEFIPPVEPERIPELLEGVSLAVLPMRADPCTDLMLPTKLLEYLALGIPVAVAPTRCIRAYLDAETTWFLERPNAQGVAHAVRELKSDPGRRAQMRRKGLDFTKRYRWSSEACRYLDLIESLSGTRAGYERNDQNARASLCTF